MKKNWVFFFLCVAVVTLAACGVQGSRSGTAELTFNGKDYQIKKVEFAVEVSPDFSIAHIQLSMLLDKDKDQMLEIVHHNKGNIKKSLSKRIGKQTRKIPDLVFHLDHGAEHAQKMDKILRDLRIPPADEE